MHQVESAYRRNSLPDLLACVVVGCNGGTNRNASVLSDFGGNAADAADVDVAVLLGEAELRGQVLAHDVAVQQGHRPAAHLEQLHHEGVGDRRLARAREARHEYCEALLVPGPMGLAKLADDVWVREPFRDLSPIGQTIAELAAGNREGSGVFRNLVDRLIGVIVRDVHHHLEGDHLDPDLLLMLSEQLLSVVRPVEGLVGGIRAGPGVIAADDEVGAAVVLADDRVPQRLARPAHAHRQRQQAQHRGLLRVAR